MTPHARRYHRVAVLMGGISSEREISLQSGRAVLDGLRDAGYEALPSVLDDRALKLPEGVEAVFIALHGQFGEDGDVQALLEAHGMPYTGSNAGASRDAFDKFRTRERLSQAGLPVPEGQRLPRSAPASAIRIPAPWVVKPPCEGSSVGITIVRRAEDLEAALSHAREYADEVLVEAYVPGREWTVGIVDDQVLPPIEILPSAGDGWYSWKAKYQSGGTTRYAFPEDLPDLVERCEACRRLALDTFRALGARGLGRVDFRVPEEGGPVILELNTIPGFTPQSLLPKAAARIGIPFAELCVRIMETARTG